MAQKNRFSEGDFTSFKNFSQLQNFNPFAKLPKFLLWLTFSLLVIILITPWWQTSKGIGTIIAVNPEDRAQNVTAFVDGRIKKWYVQDGSKVKKGDPIVEIVDNDPMILERLKAERDAKKRKMEVAKIASETSKINYERQEELFKKGLSSRREFEEAKIEYKKLLSAFETSNSELAESETKLSRQQNQVITAPKDGTVLKVLSGENATIVKAGDTLATFAPDLSELAVELYISGNDVPLVYKGRKTRLQFEGWPAIQFGGWPSVAIGTFSGVVSSVDPSVSENGKFRVIIKKDGEHEWPDQRFLRQGAKTYGWIILNRVTAGYEIWRQINGFPPIFDEQLKGKTNQ